MGSLSKAHPLSKDWPGPGLPTALDCLEGSSSGLFSWQAIRSIQVKNCSTDSSALRQSSLASQKAEPHRGPRCPQRTDSARDSPIQMCSTNSWASGERTHIPAIWIQTVLQPNAETTFQHFPWDLYSYSNVLQEVSKALQKLNLAAMD